MTPRSSIDRRKGTRRLCAVAAVLLGGLSLMLAGATGAGAKATDAPDLPPNEPLLEGQPLFKAKGCAHCHNVWGAAGEQGVGPDLGTRGSWGTLMQFAGSLWNHTPAMMEKARTQQLTWAPLSPDEMGKLAAYLFYVKFLGQPGDPERGRALFEQRLCSRCHQLEGRGGTIGPRLDELKDYVSSFFLARALWDHGPEMAAKMSEMQLERPRLEGNDVGDIVALIRGGARPTAPPELAYAEAGSPRAGMAVFRDKKCTGCHAIRGVGGTAGPDLGETQADRRVGEIAGALWNHGPAMWAKMKEAGVSFPRLSDREMADLMAYLYFVQYTDRGGDAARGATLFREKSCVQCHSAGDSGAKVGPDLAASGVARSTQQWASAMWNHAPAMNTKVRAEQVAWPQFADDEMRDLVEFLRARASAKEVTP